jgi:hypothetical protein
MSLELALGIGLLLVGMIFWSVVQRLWRLAAASAVLLVGGLPAALSLAARGLNAPAVLLLLATVSAAVLLWFWLRPRN